VSSKVIQPMMLPSALTFRDRDFAFMSVSIFNEILVAGTKPVPESETA
jgi:hypothetical protein